MLIGLMVMAIGLPITLPGILLAAFVIGAANTLGLIWWTPCRDACHAGCKGRVSSVDYLGFSLLEPVGLALGGRATKWLGPALVLVVGGGLRTLLIALDLLHPKVRHLD
jgi:hypothetical protein